MSNPIRPKRCASKQLLDSHTRWAETDGREGAPADLSGLDLRRVKRLSHRMLTALIAPGAVLYGVNFEGASLQGSNLAGADLRSAKLGGADLRGVNLSGAKLNHADLRDTKLGPLMISESRLLPARLDNVEARYADFRGADLRRIRINGSDLAYANLGDADLRDVDMTGVELMRRENAHAVRRSGADTGLSASGVSACSATDAGLGADELAQPRQRDLGFIRPRIGLKQMAHAVIDFHADRRAGIGGAVAQLGGIIAQNFGRTGMHHDGRKILEIGENTARHRHRTGLDLRR